MDKRREKLIADTFFYCGTLTLEFGDGFWNMEYFTIK